MDVEPSVRMTADAFIAWSMEQPKSERYELVDGQVIQMASERSRHALSKGAVYRRLAEAIERAGLSCQAYPDGMAVQVDAFTVYEPDAAVRCGERLAPDAVTYDDPVIVVEVLSPSSRQIDAAGKLADYFRLPSLQHYLILDAVKKRLIHHRRDGVDIATRLIVEGTLTLDPPGLALEFSQLFP